MPTGKRPDPPINTVRVACSGNVGGMPYVNVFHCFLPGHSMTSNTNLSEWLTEFHAAVLGSSIYTQRGSTLHVTQMEAVLWLGNQQVYRADNTVAISGVRPSQGLPASSCAVVSWLSTAYWRGGKPRTYLGGITLENVDTNHSLLDTEKQAIASQANSLRINVDSITTARVSETQFGFIHWAKDNAWLAQPLFMHVTGQIVHDRLGTQRRRLGPWLF